MNLKAKGMRGEYEIVAILQEAVDEVCAPLGLPKLVIERNLEQVRSSMGDGRGSDLTGLPWFAIEVKYQENDSGWNQWWEQCKAAAWVFAEKGAELGPNGRRGYFAREPVLFSRANRSPWNVRMFAYLMIENGIKIRLPVDTNLPNFLLYFKNRVKYELMKREIEGEQKPRKTASLDAFPPSTGENLPNQLGKNAPIALSTGEFLPNAINKNGEICPSSEQIIPNLDQSASKQPQFNAKTGKPLFKPPWER